MVRLIGNTSFSLHTLLALPSQAERWGCINRTDLQATPPPAPFPPLLTPHPLFYPPLLTSPSLLPPSPPLPPQLAKLHGASKLPAMLLEPLSNTSLFKWLAAIAAPPKEGLTLSTQ